MAGHADVRHEPLVASREHRFERSARTDRDLPLVGLDEVVQLDQIDTVDTHPLQRPLQLRSSRGTRPLPRLGREEHLVAVLGQPRREPIFRCAVSGCGVDVVDPPLPHQRKGRVGSTLTHPTERCGAEDHSGGSVAGRAELGSRQGCLGHVSMCTSPAAMPVDGTAPVRLSA